MRKYHPDASGGAYSDARAKRINEAYAALSDPGRRAAYDAELRAADRAPRPETAGPSARPRRPEPAAPAPTETADDFAWAEPGPKKAGLGWRLTALASAALAVAGFASGRLLASTPTHQSQAVAEPQQPEAPPPSPSPGAAKAGRAVSATGAIAAIVSRDIVPRWRADCSSGSGDLAVDIQVNLGRNGSVLSTRFAGGNGDPLLLAGAAERARLAVEQAAPFALPPESYRQWRVFIVRFDTKDACATRVARSEPG